MTDVQSRLESEGSMTSHRKLSPVILGKPLRFRSG